MLHRSDGISVIFLPLTPGDPDLDPYIHPAGFPSLLSRAYHMRPPQHFSDYDHSSNTTVHGLPPYHPLLVRHADHPQHQQSRAAGSNTVHFSDGQHEASAMQQLLSNISAAAGTNELLSFGVGSSGAQRTRGKCTCRSLSIISVALPI